MGYWLQKQHPLQVYPWRWPWPIHSRLTIENQPNQQLHSRLQDLNQTYSNHVINHVLVMLTIYHLPEHGLMRVWLGSTNHVFTSMTTTQDSTINTGMYEYQALSFSFTYMILTGHDAQCDGDPIEHRGRIPCHQQQRHQYGLQAQH